MKIKNGTPEWRIISNCQWYLTVAKLKYPILILQRFKYNLQNEKM